MIKEQQQIIDDVYDNYRAKVKLSQIPTDLTKEEFVELCKNDITFSVYWGLKIEERELSDNERQGILERVSPMYYMDQQFGGEDIFTRNNIPTKLITLTYNNEKIEIYE